MSDYDRMILTILADTCDDCEAMPFEAIYSRFSAPCQAHPYNEERPRIRLACRRLARKGLAVYLRALWTDDGDVAGAGYGPTEQGRETLRSETLRRLEASDG